MMTILDIARTECTGCLACSQVCPFSAISCTMDDEGFYIPQIDLGKCIKCGKCYGKCPANNDFKQEAAKESYILRLKNDKNLKNSASGGAFIGIAKWFMSRYEGGVVIGATIEKDLVVKHYDVTDMNDLHKLQNSKYVQSYTRDIYAKVKGYLEAGHPVLFSGTPCQIAGVYSVLGDAEKKKLITVDLVCHGVPSPAFLRKHIEYNSKLFHKEVIDYKFRVKKHGSKSFYMMMIIMRGLPAIRLAKKDLYLYLFLNGYDFRESCYRCKYACVSRTGDFTIGDCDSQELYPGFYLDSSNSIILLNSNKSRFLWEDGLKNEFYYSDLDLHKEAEYNHQLKAPFKRPKIRDDIYSQLLNEDLDLLKARYCGREGKLDRYKLLLFLHLPDKMIKKISKIKHLLRNHWNNKYIKEKSTND